MKYKNDTSGLTAFFVAFLVFFSHQVSAAKFNKDIRHLRNTLPVIDYYGIAAVLSIEEVNHYKQDPETGAITPMVWHEAIIHIPHWTTEARWCNYCSEIPLLETMQAYASNLRVQIKPSPRTPEDKIELTVSSRYSYKNFTTTKTSLPKLPEELNASFKQIMAILLGTNPVMLREFNTDSYTRWAWVDNVMGSWFEKQPIKRIPDARQNVYKFNPGDHYRMAIITDQNNKPEAVILDDAQGAFRRKVYTNLSPLYYAANIMELVHHGKQSLKFGAGTFTKKDIFTKKDVTKLARGANTFFLGHNLFEFAEHAGHLHVVQKAWKYFTEDKNATITDNQQNSDSEEEFEPDYILGAMDVGNLASTAGELIYQSATGLGPWMLVENAFSLGIGVVNLMVSAHHKSLIEGYESRIDELINYYFRVNQQALYQQYKSML